MSLNVVLYQFSKKTNSTKRPSGGTTHTVTIYGEYDILKPVLSFSFTDNATNPHKNNYLYIADNNRYYYISRWVYNNRFWLAYCEVDVLASWYSAIGNSPQFVERCSALWNPHIIDTLYPTSGDYTTTITECSNYNSNFVTKMADGTFIVGVLSEYARPDLGEGVSWYYVLDAENFLMFQQNLLSSGFIEQINKGIENPLDFITSCRWYPISPGSIPSVIPENTKIHYGMGGVIDVESAPLLIMNEFPKTINLDFILEHHPQFTERGTYTDISYTRRELQWQPLGIVPLDLTKLSEMVSIDDNRIPLTLEIDIDLHSGEGYFRLISGFAVVTSGNVSVSVNLPLSARSLSPFLIGGTSLSTVSSITPNIGSGIGGGILNLTQGMLPQFRISGTVDSVHSFLKSVPVVRSDYNILLAQENARFGRPYMGRVEKLSYIPGFIKCVSGEFYNENATKTEIDEINNFLNGGFYLE